MPSWLAACISMLPSATDTFLPSISTSTISFLEPDSAAPRLRGRALHAPLDVIGHDAGLVLYMMGELVAVMLDERPHRHGCRIAQRADGAALDVVGDAVQL